MSWFEQTFLGALSFFLVLGSCLFTVAFIFHVIWTPDENKIREIFREELAQFKEEKANE